MMSKESCHETSLRVLFLSLSPLMSSQKFAFDSSAPSTMRGSSIGILAFEGGLELSGTPNTSCAQSFQLAGMFGRPRRAA